MPLPTAHTFQTHKSYRLPPTLPKLQLHLWLMYKDLVFWHCTHITCWVFRLTIHLMCLYHILTIHHTTINPLLMLSLLLILARLLLHSIGVKLLCLSRLDLLNILCSLESYCLLNFAIITRLMTKIKHVLPSYALCQAIGMSKNWGAKTGMIMPDSKSLPGKTFLTSIVSFSVMSRLNAGPNSYLLLLLLLVIASGLLKCFCQ